METENVNVKNWKSLIKPAKLDVKISDDLTQATIVACLLYTSDAADEL